MKQDTIWCNRALFPVYFGFCPNEKAWKYSLKRMSEENKSGGRIVEPYPTADARVTYFSYGSKGNYTKHMCIVTLNENHDKATDPDDVICLLAHEAVHVWQEIADVMGTHENVHSREFEAYSIDYILKELLRAYNKTRRWKGKKKKNVNSRKK